MKTNEWIKGLLLAFCSVALLLSVAGCGGSDDMNAEDMMEEAEDAMQEAAEEAQDAAEEVADEVQDATN